MSYKDIYGYVILIVIILFIVGIFVKIIIRKINKKIKVIKVDNVRVFDLANNCVFDNEYDDKLFSMMYEASNNGILEINEFYE